MHHFNMRLAHTLGILVAGLALPCTLLEQPRALLLAQLIILSDSLKSLILLGGHLLVWPAIYTSIFVIGLEGAAGKLDEIRCHYLSLCIIFELFQDHSWMHLDILKGR